MAATISLRAVIARINRRLAHSRLAFRTSRLGSFHRDRVGVFYIAHTTTLRVIERNVDLDEYAARLGVLRDGETIKR